MLPTILYRGLRHSLTRITAPMHSLQDVDYIDLLGAILIVVNDTVCRVDSMTSLHAAEARLETRHDSRMN